MLLIFVLMCVLPSFTLKHFMTTERDRERSTSKSHEMKQTKQSVWHYFSRIFVVLLLSTNFSVEFRRTIPLPFGYLAVQGAIRRQFRQARYFFLQLLLAAAMDRRPACLRVLSLNYLGSPYILTNHIRQSQGPLYVSHTMKHDIMNSLIIIIINKHLIAVQMTFHYQIIIHIINHIEESIKSKTY